MAPSKNKKVKLSRGERENLPQGGAVSKAPKHANGVGVTGPSPRKGCLEIVQALPLDVSFEIFGHLHPKDLLNFARTSKGFRSFFLNRSNSISIWKASLSRVEGLPEKPAFLSEPAFAHMLFFPFCQNCGKSGIQKPVWLWFVRYCTDCIYDLSEPYVDPACRGYPKELVKLVMKQSKTLFNVHQTAGFRGYCLIHQPQLEQFAREWKNCGNNEGQRSALIEKQRNATEAQAKLAQRFEVWHAAQQKHRAAELEEVRQQRLQDIMDRLGRKSSEWLPEIDYFGEAEVAYHISDAPVVRQASRLTGRAWPKVLTALESEMDTLRACRLQEERQELITGRLHELEEAILEHYVRLPKTAPMDCRPNARILLGSKQCFDLVVAPSDREVTCRDFAKVLPRACSEWEASCAQALRDLVRSTIPGIPDNVDPLHLAVAVFDCIGELHLWIRCSGKAVHRYPDLLAHTCFCKAPREDSQKEEQDAIDCAAAWLSTWNGYDRYKAPRMNIHPFCSGSLTKMKYIVSALGLDPARATFEEVDDAWLWCRVCSPSSREAFSWESALFHTHGGYSVSRDVWEKVNEEDTARLRQLSAEVRPPSKDMVRWGCTLCRDWDSIGDEVERHLKEKHQLKDLEKCIEDGTVYKHYNQPFRSTYPLVLPRTGGSGSGTSV